MRLFVSFNLFQACCELANRSALSTLAAIGRGLCSVLAKIAVLAARCACFVLSLPALQARAAVPAACNPPSLKRWLPCASRRFHETCYACAILLCLPGIALSPLCHVMLHSMRCMLVLHAWGFPKPRPCTKLNLELDSVLDAALRPAAQRCCSHACSVGRVLVLEPPAVGAREAPRAGHARGKGLAGVQGVRQRGALC